MEINNVADQMLKDGHSQTAAIRRRQQQLNDRWSALQKLRASREQNLEVAERLVKLKTYTHASISLNNTIQSIHVEQHINYFSKCLLFCARLTDSLLWYTVCLI